MLMELNKKSFYIRNVFSVFTLSNPPIKTWKPETGLKLKANIFEQYIFVTK